MQVYATLSGEALSGTKYRHPLAGRESEVVLGGDYITVESGTGLVHTAPGHGQDDYVTGLKYGLCTASAPPLSPVDDAGKFTAEAGADLEGMDVLGEGNTACITALEASGSLLLAEDYPHKYPYDWRTKKPTIFRATAQWFASVDGFRDEALKAIDEVTQPPCRATPWHAMLPLGMLPSLSTPPRTLAHDCQTLPVMAPHPSSGDVDPRGGPQPHHRDDPEPE